MSTKQEIKKKGNFGVLVKQYDAARRGYPDSVFNFLRKLSPTKRPNILDIGCGTGIATRQLKQQGFAVVGADKDQRMIKVAKQKDKGIRYIVAPTHKLPFRGKQFDIVTAFTAFHWFTDKKSVGEIKRVLKPGGLFFAVLKNPSDNKKYIILNRALPG